MTSVMAQTSGRLSASGPPGQSRMSVHTRCRGPEQFCNEESTRPREAAKCGGFLSASMRSGIDGCCAQGPVDDVLGDVDELPIVVARVAAQPCEGVLHVETGPLAQHALGLLDEDAAVESVVELLVHHLGLERG